jgi:hypothetical protein
MNQTAWLSVELPARDDRPCTMPRHVDYSKSALRGGAHGLDRLRRCFGHPVRRAIARRQERSDSVGKGAGEIRKFCAAPAATLPTLQAIAIDRKQLLEPDFARF